MRDPTKYTYYDGVNRPREISYQRYSRGVFIREELLKLWDKGVISHAEIMLAACIDSMVDLDGHGCFAGNDYFAHQFRVTDRQVKNWLSNLKKLGVLIVVREQRPRVLELAWSRVPVRGLDRFQGEIHFPHQGNYSSPSNADFPAEHGRRIADGNYERGHIDICPSRGQSPPPRLGRRRTRGSKKRKEKQSMPFFPQHNHSKITQEDSANADLLHRELAKAKKTSGRRWSRKAWANQFRILREFVKDDGRIVLVLTWYVNNLQDQYTPAAYSAKTFRAKFPNIANAYDRWLQRNPQITPSPTAIKISNGVNVATWPKGANAQIELVAEISLRNYAKFFKAYSVVYNFWETEPASPERYYVLNQAGEGLADEVTYLTRWFKMVYNRVDNWKDWDGDLFKYVWRKDHKLFENTLFRNGVDKQYYQNFMSMIDENIQA